LNIDNLKLKLMSQKIIVAVITVLLVLAGGWYLYKSNRLSFHLKETPAWEKFLVFKIKNQNLSSETAGLFRTRFEETKKRLEANPDSFNDWLYLGVLKKGAGDYEGARDVWLYGAQIRPKSSTPFGNLGDLYAYFLNEPAKAEEALKKAIANDPNDYNFLLSLADLYRYKMPGREALYEQTLLEAVQKFPDNPNIIGPLASYYRQTNQVQKAIEYYEKLIKLVPTNETAKQDLAELRNK